MKLALLLVLVASSHGISLPHSFKVCNRSAPDFNACLRDAAEHNIHQLIHPFKDLRLPGLRPMVIPSLTIGSGKRAVAVEQHFTDCTLHGLDRVGLDRFEFDFEKKTLHVDALFPEITKKCHYQLNGKVLLLPVNGQGESTIAIKNMRIAGYLKYEEFKRSGHTYLVFDARNLSLDVGHVYFHFDNLFNGDKGLGDGLNKILNDNWKEVFDDVKTNYSNVMNSIIQSLCNQFWARVSMEDAFGPQ